MYYNVINYFCYSHIIALLLLPKLANCLKFLYFNEEGKD